MLEIRQKNTILAVILTVAFVELIRTAWISDDAAITLRTVLNFINGYGATFNIDERVQAYTHPLWFLLLSGLSALTKNVFTSTFFLSIGISLAVLWVLISRITTNFWAGVVSACVLILSKAYVDFSTSGLENPLSHLIILLSIFFSLKATERSSFTDITAFFLTCSLLYLNRPDLSVLVFPLALLVIFKNQREPIILAKAITIAALPVLFWTLFSIYYYGFPFPNTGYAKLGTGIPIGELVIQGGRYLLDSVDHDPLTLAFILVGTIIGLRSSIFGITLAGGGILYLAYVVSIGGDFMSGRFLTAPLLVATVLVARSDISKLQLQAITIGVGFLALIRIDATLLSNASYTNTKVGANGIADERRYYFQQYGLITAEKQTFASPLWLVGNRSVSVIYGGLGFNGITQGPGAHFIDTPALADPLLARLSAKYDPNWRIGHFVRQLPTNYQKSVEKDINLLVDPATKNYYDSIRNITRGPLNDIRRLREIARINLGEIQKPHWNMYKYQVIPSSSKPIVVNVDKLDQTVSSVPWNVPGNILFDAAVEISPPVETKIESIDLSVDNNDTYQVEYLFKGQYVPTWEINPSYSIGMVRYIRKLDTPTPQTDRVRITAISDDEKYSVGHFRVTL